MSPNHNPILGTSHSPSSFLLKVHSLLALSALLPPTPPSPHVTLFPNDCISTFWFEFHDASLNKYLAKKYYLARKKCNLIGVLIKFSRSLGWELNGKEIQYNFQFSGLKFKGDTKCSTSLGLENGKLVKQFCQGMVGEGGCLVVGGSWKQFVLKVNYHETQEKCICKFRKTEIC